MTAILTSSRREAPRATGVEALARLVGTWRIWCRGAEGLWGGSAEGVVTYEWTDGGDALVERVDLRSDGAAIRSVKIIGNGPSGGGEPARGIRARHDAGETLDLVYEIDCDTLTVRADGDDSPAHYRAVFSTDGTTLTGRWVHPGAGSDDGTAVRIT